MGVEIILLFAAPVLLLIFMSRQGRKQQQAAQQERNNALEVGNRVVTIGGFIGEVVVVGEDTVILQDVSGNMTEWLKTAIRSEYIDRNEDTPNESNTDSEADADTVADTAEEK